MKIKYQTSVWKRFFYFAPVRGTPARCKGISFLPLVGTRLCAKREGLE